MKIINAVISTLLTIVGLSGCGSMIKTQHHIVLDHNINIKVSNFNIGLTHKHVDVNGSKRVLKQTISMGDVLANAIIDTNDTK